MTFAFSLQRVFERQGHPRARYGLALGLLGTLNDSTIGSYHPKQDGVRITNGGGGVCSYVKSSIHFTIRNDLNMDTLENLCLEIQKPRSKPFFVATWYRPPDSPIGIFSPFETLIGKLDSENIEYFLMGDLNCDMTIIHAN